MTTSTTTSSSNTSKNSCQTDDVSVDLLFSSSTDLKNYGAAINNPEPPRQGVEKGTREGSLASEQVPPSVAKETTHTGPKVVATPKGLVVRRAIPLKKSSG
jgi:hypothetical protein